MLLKLLIVFKLFTTISTLSTNNLVDLPLKVPKGSYVINATLTDVNGSKSYFIQELISTSGPTIKGKILVSSDEDSFSIYYNADSQTGVNRKERLVIHGTNCLILTYKNSWDNTLPGINRPLVNQILLMGPSIFHRLDHSSLVWKSVADKNIRGIMMKGASTEVNGNLKITFYYKSHLDYQSGIESPSRIEFTGRDKALIPSTGEDNLILYVDIYSILIDAYSENGISPNLFQNEVQPPTGIGCPHYLSDDIRMPWLNGKHLSYIMEERIKGSTTARTLNEIINVKKWGQSLNESNHQYLIVEQNTTLINLQLIMKLNYDRRVHAAHNFGFLVIKASESEVIYDYRLGVSFRVGANGSIDVAFIDSNTPGVDSHGSFTFFNLFMFYGPSRYLGKCNLQNRFGLPVEAWESVEYDFTINGKKVDKAVITQY